MRALVQDHALLAQLRAGAKPLLQEDLDPGPYDAFTLGRLLALFGEEPLRPPWCDLIERRFGSSAPIKLGEAVAGWSAEHAARCEDGHSWVTDPGSRLSDWFAARQSPFEMQATTFVSSPPSATKAQWRCRPREVELRGAALDLRVRSVCLKVDETDSTWGYLSFGCPGESAIRLSFRATGAAALGIRLMAQKGVREALPFRGEAGFDLLVDGVSRYSIDCEENAAWAHFPLRKDGSDGPREIEIRLKQTANTTLRIYEIQLQ